MNPHSPSYQKYQKYCRRNIHLWKVLSTCFIFHWRTDDIFTNFIFEVFYFSSGPKSKVTGCQVSKSLVNFLFMWLRISNSQSDCQMSLITSKIPSLKSEEMRSVQKFFLQKSNYFIACVASLSDKKKVIQSNITNSNHKTHWTSLDRAIRGRSGPKSPPEHKLHKAVTSWGFSKISIWFSQPQILQFTFYRRGIGPVNLVFRWKSQSFHNF